MIYSKKDIELIRAITLDQYFASERPEDLIDKGNGRYDVKYNGEWHTSLSIIPLAKSTLTAIGRSFLRENPVKVLLTGLSTWKA